MEQGFLNYYYCNYNAADYLHVVHNIPIELNRLCLCLCLCYDERKNLADLHEWLLESDAGDKKEFLVGKKQRKTLHKHCDHLVKTN